MKLAQALKYDANYIIGIHHLKRSIGGQYLNDLLNTIGFIEAKYIDSVEECRKSLEERGNYWDNGAFKMNFLAHILSIPKFHEPEKLNIFYRRPITWEYNGKRESVTCDCLLAKPFGVYAPDVPYFFLQEFKKQKQNEDAEGQMLLAMLIAQHKNANEKPIYGCYIQGKFWVFTTLHDKNYCVSRAYDATQKADLYQIIFILRQLKHIILTELSV
jgi:hypothetical protein